MEEPLSVELNDFHLPWAQKIPLATSHPYRFVIRKAYVKPSAKLDDPVDLNLTFARIVNSLQSKEGLLQQCLAASADKTAGRSLEDAVRGDQKLEAIRAAMRLPFYFSQNFAGVDTAHFPGCKLKVFVQTSGIVIADAEKKDATGAPFAHATLSFDDFIVDESAVADGVVSINAGTASADGKPFAIRCTSNIVADDLSRTLREYRTELLAKAQFAVGLGDFERDNFRFKAGTLIKILDRDNTNGWYQGQLNDVTEWFPRELAMLLTSENPVVGANKLMVLKGEALQKMNAIVAGPVPPAQTSGNEVKPIKAGEKNEKSVSFVATVEAAVLKNDGLRPKSVAVNGVIKDAWAQFAKTHMAVEEKSTKGGILSAIKTGFRSTPKPSQDPESVAKEIMARSKFTDVGR